MRQALINIIILLLTLGIQTAPTQAEDACDKAVIAYRLPGEDPDANECIAFITVGYVHGVEVGQTGEVRFKTRRHNVKKVTLEILDTEAYLSTCRLTGVTADKKIRNDRVRLECQEWSVAQSLEKAARAFEAGDWAQAQHFYSKCRDSLPPDQVDLICDRMDQCAQHVMEERNRKLSKEEKERENRKKPFYWDLAVHYLLRCDYAAAKEFNDRLLRVAEDDKPAKEMRDLIYMTGGTELASEEAKKYAVCNIDDNLAGGRELSIPDVWPRMVKEARIEYPPEAERNGVEGTIWVKSLVDTEGRPVVSRIGKSSGSVALDFAAVKAAFGNKYTPAQHDGKPVAVWVTFKVEFVLHR